MVAEKKKVALKKIKEILKSYNTILLFDLHEVLSKQLHYIRNKLKEQGIFTLISKKKIVKLAFEENNINLSLDDITQPGLVYSNKPIFEVARIIRNLKVKRKAKVGEKALVDIEIPAGDTGVQAGPAISIFKQFKIQTMMKDGKIFVKEPTVVCEAGKSISSELVSLLNMLKVEPIEMNLVPVKGYFENTIYNKFVLNLDKDYFVEAITTIGSELFKLTTYLNYPTKNNINYLLLKASRNAKSLGIKLGMPAKEILSDLLRIAHSNANKLNK